MTKSTCYRLVRDKDTGATKYISTPSYLEVMKDPSGKEFRIHFHKIQVAPKIFKWSCTEESTGLKCIDNMKSTKQEALERMKEIIPVLNHVLSKHTHYIERMREFKEQNRIK